MEPIGLEPTTSCMPCLAVTRAELAQKPLSGCSLAKNPTFAFRRIPWRFVAFYTGTKPVEHPQTR